MGKFLKQLKMVIIYAKRFERSRLYILMRRMIHKLISNKKRGYLENKLNESNAKPKELWKVLKYVDLLNRNSPCQVSAPRTNKTVQMTLQTYF